MKKMDYGQQTLTELLYEFENMTQEEYLHLYEEVEKNQKEKIK